MRLNRIAIGFYPERDHAELLRLDARCDALGVRISPERCRGRYPGWKVRVRGSEDRVIDLRSDGEGPLEPVLAGALDDWEVRFGGAWTPEELVQIASQSGIEVRNA